MTRFLREKLPIPPLEWYRQLLDNTILWEQYLKNFGRKVCGEVKWQTEMESQPVASGKQYTATEFIFGVPQCEGWQCSLIGRKRSWGLGKECGFFRMYQLGFCVETPLGILAGKDLIQGLMCSQTQARLELWFWTLPREWLPCCELRNCGWGIPHFHGLFLVSGRSPSNFILKMQISFLKGPSS